jgi:hypothetical protein
MRTESSITSITWIPSEAIEGMPKLPFEWGTANRDVLAGVDTSARRTTSTASTLHQCRTPAALEPDLCPNAHGLDQNIYGQSLTLPVG